MRTPIFAAVLSIVAFAGLAATAQAQSCPTNLRYLEDKLPRYNYPQLEQVRQAILSEDVTAAMARMRAAGMSPAQAATMTLQQSREAEQQTLVAEECVRKTSTNPDALLNQLRNGSYQFSGRDSIMESCLAQYVNMYYAQVAYKEIAVAISCLANR